MEDFATVSDTGGADSKLSSTLFHGYFLQCPEVALDVIPLEQPASLIETAVKLLAQQKGEETAENMSAYCLILFVKDGSGVEHGFDVPKDLLHLTEVSSISGESPSMQPSPSVTSEP